MRKFISFFILALLANVAVAQTVSKTINVATAGTLSSLLTSTEKTTITDLTITGNIDARDVKCMRDEITKLAVLDMSGVSIVAYTGWATYPMVPVSYPANEMPQYSFYNYSTSKITLKTIKLPNSLTSIGSSAFSGCYSLSGSLIIPNSVTSIGNSAFSGCNSLTGSLIIPNSVTTIDNSAFESCSSLSGSLTIGTSVTSIGYSTFHGTSFRIINSLNTTPPAIAYNSFYLPSIVYVPAASLAAYKTAPNWSTYTITTEKRVTINNPTAGSLAATIILAGYGPLSSITHLTVTGNLNSIDIAQMKTNMTVLTDIDLLGTTLANNTLPANAFKDKTTLSSVQLPSTLLTIGDYAFSGCSGLSCMLPVPASVTSIGAYAFQICSGLSGGLTLPNGITTISSYAFYGCKNLNGSLSIPNSVTSIGDFSFASCTGLSGDLTMGSSVTSIGSSAFSSCIGLSGNLTIPNSVTSIGSYAFSTCRGFSALTLPNTLITIGPNAFNNCTGLNGVLTIPISVSSIGSNAFENCTLLTELNIGKNTSSIGDYAFNNCTGVNKITVARTAPPTISAKTFGAINKETCSLIVPTSSTLAYQIANYWSEFIFFSEKNFDLSVGLTEISDARLKVYATQTEIILEGTTPGEKVTVYTIGGVQLQSVQSQGDRIVISAPQGATYLVKTASKTVKVAL